MSENDELRFIDYASHGGCSKKLDIENLHQLLNTFNLKSSYFVDNSFSDAGIYQYQCNGIKEVLVSTVDIVLPMTLNPQDFGVITVNHVLNDLYSCGAVPLFALCILGIPEGMTPQNKHLIEMLDGANQRLNSEGAVLLGGHTLKGQSDLFLGFTSVGKPISNILPHHNAQVGDSILLTKPLGTSMASLRWKMDEGEEGEHLDVLEGMKLSNKEAAQIISAFPINALTDISGYGLLGHLYEVIKASNRSARVYLDKLQTYSSVTHLLDPYKTQQFTPTYNFLKKYIKISKEITNEVLEAALFDAQVSGPLLLCVPSKFEVELLRELNLSGYQASKIGEIFESKNTPFIEIN